MIRSAPTFFPLLGHPYFGPKTLQEEKLERKKPLRKRRDMVLGCFIGISS
jgi:hypothetical protein